MLITISGMSGSGKNTVMNTLTQKVNNIKILNQSTATTRSPRGDNNQTYIHISKEQFEKAIKDGCFIEYELVHDNYYGTLKQAFIKVEQDKENDYIRDIDVKGVLSLKKYFKDKLKIVSIFLDVPEEELRERLKQRGETEEQIEKRLSRGELEKSYKKYYDLVIENTDLEKTVKEIIEFIKTEKAK